MPQKELTTDEVIQAAKDLTKVIKDKEAERSELIGRRSSLNERLDKELGFESVKKAKTAMQTKQLALKQLIELLHKKFAELKERPEWNIMIQESMNDS